MPVARGDAPPRGAGRIAAERIFVPFAQLDHAAIARNLSQIADHRGDLADAFFERLEEIELPSEDSHSGFRVRRESGVAARLVRDGQTWLATRDGISAETFTGALRRVARALPRTSYPKPRFSVEQWSEAPEAPELAELPSRLHRQIRAHHVSFNTRLAVRRHRRWVRVVGIELASAMEEESFYSVEATLPWGRYGTLLNDLGDVTVESLARRLVHYYRAREAAPPDPWDGPVVLGPSTAAVLLHEAVAHALEADTLALSGHPEAAVGVELGSEHLHIFDDPTSAPEGVRRKADDEGCPTGRRCLVRAGVVEQPLCDGFWARRSDVLRAGAGRRAHRHVPPGPRSSHLELMPGEASREDLMGQAEGGLYLPEAERGALDPRSGEFQLTFPYGFRIEDQAPGAPVGRCQMRLHVSEVLRGVRAVGREAVSAGAGWCAKGGMKLPVWATSPPLLLSGVVIRP